MKSIAVVSSLGTSLVNFRGPLISSLIAKDIRVYALAPDLDEDLSRRITAMGAVPLQFRLARTGMNPISDLLNMVALARLLRSLKVDAIFGYTIKPVIYGTLAAAMAGIPRRFALISGLGYVFTPSGGGEPLRRRILLSLVSWLYRFALGFNELVFFQNQDDRDLFVAKSIVNAQKTIVVSGSGVDLMEWQVSKPVTTPMTFLLAARLLREKGILEYIDACRVLKDRHPSSRFILLGGLDSNPGMLSKEVVEGWVREGIVEWPGHVNVRPWIEAASVYVLPSYREGVPRSTQEAMAMGRPVITTDVPGCRETVIDGKNGFLVPVRDSRALADAMEKFIMNPQLVGVMGQASRVLAEARFDVKKINLAIMAAMGL